MKIQSTTHTQISPTSYTISLLHFTASNHGYDWLGKGGLDTNGAHQVAYGKALSFRSV